MVASERRRTGGAELVQEGQTPTASVLFDLGACQRSSGGQEQDGVRRAGFREDAKGRHRSLDATHLALPDAGGQNGDRAKSAA